MMFVDCQMVVVYGDQNTWNTIPVSGQKNTLNNRTIIPTNENTEQNKTELQ
jgi:hypothetical protein